MVPLTRPHFLKVLICVAVAVGLGMFLVSQLRVTMDITEFLPDFDDPNTAAILDALPRAAPARTMVISASGASMGELMKCTRGLRDAMSGDPRIEWMEAGPPEEFGKRLFDTYYDRRFSFIDRAPRRWLDEKISDASLVASLRRMKSTLTLPGGAALEDVVKGDPLMIFAGLMDRLTSMRHDGFRVSAGQYISADGNSALLIAGTVASPLDSAAQDSLLADVHAFAASVCSSADGYIKVGIAGLNVIATGSAQRIRADSIRLSFLATFAVVSLLAVTFRSLRPLAVMLLPLGLAYLAAVTAVVVQRGTIHGLTLAFGATLLGVLVDYPLHTLMHARLLETSGHAANRRLWTPLLLAAATTLVGFGCLGSAAYRGMREIALFALVAVPVALLVTRLVVAPLVSASALGGHSLLVTARMRFLVHVRTSRLVAGAALAILMAGAGTGMLHVSWHDDLTALSSVAPERFSPHDGVENLVFSYDPGRVAVVLESDVESALRVSEALADVLDRAVDDGLLDGYASITNVLWSQRLQRENERALRAVPHLIDRVDAALRAEGFVPAAFEEFRRAISEPPPTPLTRDDLWAADLGILLRLFELGIEDNSAFVTLLRNIHDGAALADRIETVPGAIYVDQRGLMTDSFTRYRRRAGLLVLVGMAAAIALLAGYYRSWRAVVRVVSGIVLATAMTFGCLGWVVGTLNFLHVLSLLLVFCIGVDYAVLADAARHANGGDTTTWSSIVLAAVLTVAGFGILATSNVGALAAVGSTVAIGASLAVVCTALCDRILTGDD